MNRDVKEHSVYCMCNLLYTFHNFSILPQFIYTQCGYTHYIRPRCHAYNNVISMCSSFKQGNNFCIGMIIGLSLVSVETKSSCPTAGNIMSTYVGRK